MSCSYSAVRPFQFSRGPIPGVLGTDFAREPLRPDAKTGLGRLVSGERLIHITDIRDDDLYRSGDRLRVATVELAGARTHLLVPLRKDAALLGIFSVYRQEVRPFTDKQIALLQNFAAQAVIAIENARLITETREALEQQTATAEVLQVINSSPGDLAPVFDAMLDRAMRLCEAACGFLFTYDGERFQTVAHQGIPAHFAAYLPKMDQPSPTAGMAARILGGARFVHVTDLREEDAYRLGAALRRALVDLGGGRTAVAVPLRKDDVVLGFFTIYRQEIRPFSDKQIALLENFAAQAVIAIENARLLGELQQRTGDLQERSNTRLRPVTC